MPRPTRRLQRDAERLVDPADLLDRHAQAGEVAAAAAVLLRGGEPEHAELTQLLHDLDREVMIAVPAGGMGRDLCVREITDDLAEGLVLDTELEGHDGAFPDVANLR